MSCNEIARSPVKLNNFFCNPACFRFGLFYFLLGFYSVLHTRVSWSEFKISRPGSIHIPWLTQSNSQNLVGIPRPPERTDASKLISFGKSMEKKSSKYPFWILSIPILRMPFGLMYWLYVIHFTWRKFGKNEKNRKFGAYLCIRWIKSL